MSSRKSRLRSHPRARRGAALVEFAFAAPILIVFTLTLIELARLFTIQNTVENAAMEGARRAIVPGASAFEAQQSATSVLTAVRIQNTTVTVNPTVISAATPTVTVNVVAPVAGNTWIPSRFFRGKQLSKSITLTRETAP